MITDQLATVPPVWLHGLAGGCLIGLGSLLALAATGKVPGISGVFGRVLRPKPGDIGWRIVFLLGLIGGAGLMILTNDHAAMYRIPSGRNLAIYALAGLIVGFGTRLGGGCTSGHGICGTGSGARDSMLATAVFMATGILTVLLWNLVVGGAP